MRLSNRVVRYVTIVMCVVSLVTICIIGVLSLRAAGSADGRSAAQTSMRAKAEIDEMLDSLRHGAFDSSAQDDTYAFMTTNDEAYVAATLTPEALANLDADLAAVYDATGNLIATSGRTATGGRTAEHPWAAELVVSNPSLNLSGTHDAPVSGVFSLADGQLLMIGAGPVLPSTRQGSALGTFVVARLLDASTLEAIAANTQLELSVAPRSGKDAQPARRGLRVVSDVAQMTLPLRDASGAQTGALLIASSRAAYESALDSLGYLALCVTLVIVASILVLYQGLRQIVIDRVSALDEIAARICETGVAEPIDDGGDDELGTLSATVSAMVVALDESRHEIEEARDASDSRYRLLIDNLAEAVFVIDRCGVIQFVSPGIRSILGYAPESLVGREIRSLLDTESGDLLVGRIGRGLTSVGAQLALRVRTREDILLDAEVVLTPFGGTSGDVQGILRDVTARRRYENELLHIASHDFLTGLCNRRRFEEELSRELARAQRHGSCGAVLWLDLDNFKDVNDTLGHKAGDDMLIRVAGQLTSSARGESLLARLGGDEFAILLPGADAADAEGAAERVLKEIRLVSMHIEGKVAHASASIGVVLYPEHGAGVDELLARADIAMYRAKEMGRARFRVFETGEQWRDEIEDRRTWIELVELALAEDGLIVYAQPITDLLTGRTVSYELLVRMLDLEGGIIPPGRFLPVAERVGLIVDIDLWVLRQAAQILSADPDADFRLNVNVSARTLNDPRFLPALDKLIEENRMDTSRLVIEITETAIVVDVAGVQDTLQHIKRLGCRIALDDFGSGFTSFLHLKQLPVDDIKIDGSFVQNLCESTNDQHLVRAMVEMARGLDVRTTAEFVESPEALNLLRSFGVEMGQGFHIAMPGPAGFMIDTAMRELTTHL